MRALILIAGAALALSGCNGDQAAENTVHIDATATADDITSNDTTAIDAATGDDANMAADVDYTINADEEPGDTVDNASSGARSTNRSRPSEGVREPAREPATEAANTLENSE